MAAPTQSAPRPGRTLAILIAVIVALGVWTFWPGQVHTPKLGLDLQGGTQVILTPVSATGAQITDDQLNQTVEIIRQRVDGFGVAEADVATQGSGSNATILVSIPGVTNQAVLDALSTTAKLDFRPVLQEGAGFPQTSASPSASASASASSTVKPSASSTVKPSATASSASASASSSGNGAAVTGGLSAKAGTASPTPSASPSASASSSASASPTPRPTQTTDASGITSQGGLPPIQSSKNDAALQAAYDKLDCSKTGALIGGPVDPQKYLVTCSKDGSTKYLLDKAAVQGTEIASASAGLSSSGSAWQVNLTFTSTGATQFADITAKLAQNHTNGLSPTDQFGIVLDGLVESSPYVAEQIIGGSAQITGSFTADEAKALANVLNYGSLPVSLQVSSVEQVSPTLGTDQLHAGLIAGALGLLLVVIYLCIYYRALGLVAVASLLIAAVITYEIFVILGRQLGLALSLAGVAGAIVAIGITADSFVVYFERIRDEVREGRSLRAAGDAGWVRARRTILAADFVSFLAAIVLYFLSVGNVRGFAFTLGLTTIVDVVVAFLFTRPLVSLLMRTKFFQSGSHWTGISPDRLGVKAEIVPVAVGHAKES